MAAPFRPWQALLAVAWWCFTSTFCQIAPGQQVSPAAGTAAVASGQKLILAFRMQDWKAQHLHDAEQAQKQADTLRTLGCEVKTAQHNGHIDVQCRTVFWKSLALDSSEQLAQWTAWLQQVGFDTIHGREVSAAKPAQGTDGKPKEIVRYRSSQWRSQHVHQASEVGQLTTLFTALGCELEKLDHNGHTDLKFRCAGWKEIELPTHEAAHSWQEFLNSHGFETTHEH